MDQASENSCKRRSDNVASKGSELCAHQFMPHILNLYGVRAKAQDFEIYAPHATFEDPLMCAHGVKQIKSAFYSLKVFSESRIVEYTIDEKVTSPGKNEILIDNKQHYKFMGRDIDMISLIVLLVEDGKVVRHEDSNKSSVSGDGVMSLLPLVEDKVIGICHTESVTTTSTNSSLPSWLQKCKEESRELSTPHDQEESVQMKELCKRWNLIYNNSTSHKNSKFPEKTINLSSCSPSPSPSISSYDNNYCKPLTTAWPTHVFEPKWATKEEHQFLIPNSQNHLFKTHQKPELLSNANSTPNSASASETTEPVVAVLDRFKENNPENLEALCAALVQKAPWQKDIIPEIATTTLRCRSGNSKQGSRIKQETWLSFLGADDDGKHKIARELGRVVFGTQTSSFKSIELSSFSSSTRADSTEMDSSKNSNKRARDESGHGFLERLAHAVKENPHRVFYAEDVEQLDQGSQKGIRRAMEVGKFVLSDGETVPLEDAIVIFSCESFSSASRACSPRVRQKLEGDDDHEEREISKVDDVDEANSSFPLDLNLAVDDDDDDHRVGNIRILEAVDKQIFFRVQVL